MRHVPANDKLFQKLFFSQDSHGGELTLGPVLDMVSEQVPL